jgi:putative transposase
MISLEKQHFTMSSFRNVYTALLLVIARSTDRELARQVSYLKSENQILRSRLPERLILTQREKSRLVRFAKNLGSAALNQLATIAHPGTIRRWIREAASRKSALQNRKTGRPRTAAQIEKLILKLAAENGWGYCRILGELRKLGVRSITRNTVKAILKRNGYETGPKRGPGTWDEFIKRHAKTLWQCDFFSKRIISKSGFRDVFVLVFLHVESRKVFITPATYKPDQAWMIQQAEAFSQYTKDEDLACKTLMLDNDGKYSQPFLDALKSSGIKTKRTAIRSPNTVAFVERIIQTIQQEVLDHFIIFGRSHMDVLCTQFRDHYHLERPHQGLDNELIEKPPTKGCKKIIEQPDTIRLSDIRCHERLGGLLKSYSRKVA